MHSAFTLKKQMAKQSVEDSESSCFEGVVPMAVEFLWKKTFFFFCKILKRWRGLAKEWQNCPPWCTLLSILFSIALKAELILILHLNWCVRWWSVGLEDIGFYIKRPEPFSSCLYCWLAPNQAWTQAVLGSYTEFRFELTHGYIRKSILPPTLLSVKIVLLWA